MLKTAHSERVLKACDAFRQAEEQLKLRHIEVACNHFNEAECLGFDADACASGRWTCHMLAGNFEAGWSESDQIERRKNPDPNRFWTGAPLNGRRVLIRCLHGLGDTIQYGRYISSLRTIARSVTLESQPPLKPLLTISQIADQVITWGEPEPSWDEQIEIIELPRIFRATAGTIPRQIPYLRTRLEGSRKRDAGDGLLKVAIVWAGSPFNPGRSVPLRKLEPLLSIPGTQIASLQGEPDRADLATIGFSIPDLYESSGSILSAAETLQSLDLLITVDTMMAHLAGSLGVPCWTLLPFEADWRWLLDRTDSPWYPSMRLFRQKVQGCWEPVIEQVSEQLRLAARTGLSAVLRLEL